MLMATPRCIMLSFLLLWLATVWMALIVGGKAHESDSLVVPTALPLWASSSPTGLPSMSNRDNRAPLTSDETPGVTIATDKQYYRVGEPIWVMVENTRHDTIYVPAEPNACSIMSVYRFEGGQWVAQQRCPTRAALAKVPIPPGSRITGQLGQGQASSYSVGPIVGALTVPQVFEGHVKDLPKVKPWQPGDPTWEVPRGGPLPERRRPPFDALTTPLGEGRYHIRVRYTIGAASGPVGERVSAEFQIGY
jgi:hypothetical protein